VDIPPKKGTGTGLYIPQAVIVPVSKPFSGGISTEEGFKNRQYTFWTEQHQNTFHPCKIS
jgi:hypothetical protein